MNKFAPKDYKSSVDHIREDILPYIYCCKAGMLSMCDSYYQRRPSDKGDRYQPPPPGTVHKRLTTIRERRSTFVTLACLTYHQRL